MTHQIHLGDIAVDVVLKDIKNIHLSVYPPSGKVRIAAPERMKLDTIRVYAISKLPWIKKQQKKLRDQARESKRDYIDRESHYVFGQRCLLTVIEADTPAKIEKRHNRLTLTIRPGTSEETKQERIDEWYRQILKQAAEPMIARWEPLIGVKVNRLFIQKMKTKWGSCNPAAATIRLNTGLATKPPACLEYIVVHEMIHILEPTHNTRFVALMNQFMPNWKHHRQTLNRLPLAHVDWGY